MPHNKLFKHITFEPQIWPELTQQHGHGMLIHHQACYALWFYYGVGYNTYVKRIRDKILIEGEKEPIVNHKELMKSTSILYGVEPEQMIRFWQDIDIECIRTFKPLMPDFLRFNKPIVILATNL